MNDMKTDAEAELRANASFFECKRARRAVLDEFSDSYTSEYSELEAYAAELAKKTNPGTIARERLEDSSQAYYRPRWLFFENQIQGGSCRLQLEETRKNKISPSAWACVNQETKVNWRWFLTTIAEALELGDGVELTIISDMRKGLLQAAVNILPEAEHRWCARHIYANWNEKNGEEERCIESTPLTHGAGPSSAADASLMQSTTTCLRVSTRYKPVRTMMDFIAKVMNRLGAVEAAAAKSNEIYKATNKSSSKYTSSNVRPCSSRSYGIGWNLPQSGERNKDRNEEQFRCTTSCLYLDTTGLESSPMNGSETNELIFIGASPQTNLPREQTLYEQKRSVIDGASNTNSTADRQKRFNVEDEKPHVGSPSLISHNVGVSPPTMVSIKLEYPWSSQPIDAPPPKRMQEARDGGLGNYSIWWRDDGSHFWHIRRQKPKALMSLDAGVLVLFHSSMALGRVSAPTPLLGAAR
ncbi:transposon protein [Musa troglodytarum]|uniref:Transposon protein n=1 Tax=Musa troglodytarum TaxID=320322 RepID=A0A9E7KTC3_9LILI|nr:transposon protein [Musa troglodytarum]